MNRRVLSLYHALPPAAQNALASVRGLQLYRRRFGAGTDRLVKAALERERWTDAQWRAWREPRLARLLERARFDVPYYRRAWDEIERDSRGRSYARLQDWPRLPKSALRAAPREFLAIDCDPSRMIHEQTSGTTGTPLNLWQSRQSLLEWYALFEARWRVWHGVSRHDRWGILGGQLVVPVSRTRPPYWVWSALSKQLYLSVYHIGEATAAAYVRQISRRQVRYLYGYTSALYALAGEMNRQDLSVPMKVVITNAEPLHAYQRTAIERAFACPVRESYGASELAVGASECERGRLHLWPDAGVLEVDNGDTLVTGLVNLDMPLIRYEIGDRLTLAAPEETCGCGRTLPLLDGIDGREDDVLFTRQGRRVGRMDPAFKSTLPIREAQIVQDSLDRVRVRYVPAPGFDDRSARELVTAIRDRLGDIDVALEPLGEIPKSANGKFRAVICAIPPDARPVAR